MLDFWVRFPSLTLGLISVSLCGSERRPFVRKRHQNKHIDFDPCSATNQKVGSSSPPGRTTFPLVRPGDIGILPIDKQGDVRWREQTRVFRHRYFCCPPGTQTKIKAGVSRRELDRPIYFIELRDGYACSWCELKGGQLRLVPHVNSPQEIRTFAHPTEAEIIGRVTGVAMRIANMGHTPFFKVSNTISDTTEK